MLVVKTGIEVLRQKSKVKDVDDNGLMALAMYTQRSLCIVFYGNFNVRVICGDAVSAVPDVQQLSAVCFPDKIIVIEFIDHNSFPRPERDQIPS